MLKQAGSLRNDKTYKQQVLLDARLLQRGVLEIVIIHQFTTLELPLN